MHTKGGCAKYRKRVEAGAWRQQCRTSYRLTLFKACSSLQPHKVEGTGEGRSRVWGAQGNRRDATSALLMTVRERVVSAHSPNVACHARMCIRRRPLSRSTHVRCVTYQELVREPGNLQTLRRDRQPVQRCVAMRCVALPRAPPIVNIPKARLSTPRTPPQRHTVQASGLCCDTSVAQLLGVVPPLNQ